MTKIVSCCSTKDKTYTPPAGVKIDKCKSCSTLVWLPREADAAKVSGREVWCKECVETKATPQDDILGKSVHNVNKVVDVNAEPTTLDERIESQYKELHETLLKDIDDKLGLLASVAINNLAPNKDAEHLMLAGVIKIFIEERLMKMKEEMGPSSTLGDVLNRFEGQDKIAMLTFVVGVYHAAKNASVKSKFPSWSRRDNGQDEDYEKNKDKNWNWDLN
jgi:hypothetical protein